MNILCSIKNILRLFYYIFKYDICLSEYFSILTQSNIGEKVKLYGSYHISNTQIGDYTYLAMNAKISNTTIGKYCSIGPNLLCGWGIHPLNGISTSPMFYSTMKQNGYSVCTNNKTEERKPITIGNDVFIGANVTVLDGITIGDGAVIGAGAVVSKDIPPYAIAVGCPIKVINYRFNKDTIDKLLDIKWWDKEGDIHEEIESNFFDIEHFFNRNYSER